jgi:pimeloyl-ACP methyl ester carboxylesterase
MASNSSPIAQASLEVNGVEFAYLAVGDDGPLALCLHGYPDSAHTWTALLLELAGAGYRAVAPFMRGYSPTAVPADGRYQTGMLSLDAIGFHEALGGDGRSVLIGHDWGAIAVHGAAVHAPDRWSKVVSMAVPPGEALMGALQTNLTQLKRSWYAFFQTHPLSDAVVPLNDLAFIDLLWADWSPGFEAAEHIEHAKRCLRGPANLAAALGYYRAVIGDGLIDPSLADVQEATGGIPSQPTLCLHGANDGCIGAEVAESARAYVTPNVRIEVLSGCGHFLHLERPADVNARILEFLA